MMMARMRFLPLLLVAFLSAEGAVADDGQVLDLSFEDLLATTVTSVSKRSQPLHDAATAVFVITADDIRRCGATSVPEALRLVPGLHVARLDASRWAITARGFNGRFSNKLLVLLDGRSCYTTSFSGVYWEIQDLMLEDIDRIEIIRGPGSTLWGANAVNGVINIITRNAVESRGGVGHLAAGDHGQLRAGLRGGLGLRDGWSGRAHVKGQSQGTFPRGDGSDAGDAWERYQAGFRVDTHGADADRYMFQGNLLRGEFDQEVILPQVEPPYATVTPDIAVATAGNLLARWQRTLSPTAEMSLQAYYDQTGRDEVFAHERTRQVDLEFQHSFTGGPHTFVWGTGYRFTRNTVDGKRFFELASSRRDYNLFCAFIQDEISLFEDRLAVTGGTKFENNEYTGNELQPSLRGIWTVAEQHRVWASASRAVRTPMRAEDEFRVTYTIIPPGTPYNPGPLPVAMVITGSSDMDSEVLKAYEIGYRFATQDLSLDACCFYNDYDNLRGTVRGQPVPSATRVDQPMIFTNLGVAWTRGFELAAAFRPVPTLRTSLAYSYIDESDLRGSGNGSEAISPAHQVSLNNDLQLGEGVHCNLWLRHLGAASASGGRNLVRTPIPAFTTLDLRLSWQLRGGLEIAVSGQNLLEERHLEYAPESFLLVTEVPRLLAGSLAWSF